MNNDLVDIRNVAAYRGMMILHDEGAAIMPDANNQPNYIELSAEIVAAYVTKNSVQMADLPALIGNVYAALNKAGNGQTEQPQEKLEPAVSVKKSVTPDYIICLEDGRRFKSLKRHLRTAYNMTPDQYRAKWGLPADYPVVSPNYAKARSELAKTMGLGQKRRNVRKARKAA